jgi:DNA-binding response OmpR family regulator
VQVNGIVEVFGLARNFEGKIKKKLMPTSHQPKNKILIIEDEPDLCLILEVLLKDDDTSIYHVKRLKAAKESLEEDEPHLILLDNRLPDGLGLDFLPFIKENYPGIRIIMISGKDSAAKDLALENGAHIFLAKPFTKDKLHNSVHALLN